MYKSFFCGVVAAVMLLAVLPVFAADISFKNGNGLAQDAFKSLSKDAGVAIGYRNMAPAAPLEITGLDVGVEVSAIRIDKNSTCWREAFNNDAPSYLLIPTIRARKGLPLGIDVGAMYSYVPDSNIKLYGAEISKAVLEGGVATPAVGVRATYTKLTGVDDLGMQTFGVDASVSKGFVFITPYAGAGLLFVNSEAKGALKTLSQSAGVDLKKENITVPRVFGGIKISPFPLLGITLEAEYAVIPIYSLRVALSF